MWKYETTISWDSGKEGRLHSGGKSEIRVASPPEFGGPHNQWTPEDLVSGAVSSCIMTSSLFFLEKAGIKPLSYLSNASATMEKTPSGLAFTGVTVDVSVAVKTEDEIEKAYSAVRKAKESCPVSKSLTCDVTLKAKVSCPGS